MITVFVDPIPALGVAMRRVARALHVTAPPWARVVDDVTQADVQVLHAVALEARRHLQAPRYAVVMHCLESEQDSRGGGGNVPIRVPPGMEPWEAVWRPALVVWSYYDLAERFAWRARCEVDPLQTWVASSRDGVTAPCFYYAPLGVDGETFRHADHQHLSGHRDVGIITTGFVSGPQAEAIEEAAIAAQRVGLTTVHLGPAQVEGMTAQMPGWSAVSGIADTDLAALYGRSRWVSGLRHAEGFELPVLEGLVCGARPICFDLPCYRRWFDGHAVFVPESHGPELIDRLVEIMLDAPEPVTLEERDAILARFDWRVLGRGFWQALEATCLADAQLAPLATAPRPAAVSLPARDTRRRLVWVGDSPTTDWTGFGRATAHIVRRLLPLFDVTVLGTTHDGFPYDRARIPYDVYPISKGVGPLVSDVRPDVVVIQHDPWHVQHFMHDAGNALVVATMPIDGKNCRCDYLNGLALAIWWTHFAEREARLGGYVGPSAVIPLGVDLDVYQPSDRRTARQRIGLPESVWDAFLVGVVARNQPRKRLDLTVRHFAEWVKSRGVHDAYLYVQAAATGEVAYDVSELMRYEQLSSRLIIFEPVLRKVVAETQMAQVYSALNVYFSTSQGEGWGLPPMEAMACGVPVVAPDWAGLGDWARSAACLVPCADIAATINPMGRPLSGVRIGVLGGVPDRQANVAALDRLYRDHAHYAERRAAGLALVARPEYRWEAIGDAFRDAIAAVLDGRALTGVLGAQIESIEEEALAERT